MLKTFFAIAAALSMLCQATASATDAGSEARALSAPVMSLAAAVNASRLTFPSDALTDDCVVVGSSAPFIWSPESNGGCHAWYAAVVGASDQKTRDLVLRANEHLAVGPAANVNVQGALGYATFNATWNANAMGKPFTKHFLLTVIERQTDHGWRIAFQSWGVLAPA